MGDFDFGLVDVEDIDDVQLASAEDYQDETDPAPLAPGVWEFRVDDAGLKRDRDGNLLKDGKYPVVQVKKLTVVAPQEFAGRQVYVFKDYSLKPLANGNRKGAVPAVDLLRGLNDQHTFASGQEVIELLGREFEKGSTVKIKTDWVAKDSDYIKEVLAEAGGFDNMDQDERNALFNKAILRGQKKFPKKNGQFVHEWEGPSGEKVTARVNLQRIFPSSKDVKLGPAGGGK